MGMPDELSESEKRLVATAYRGMVDFRTDADDGPHEAAQRSEDRRIQAQLITALVSHADSLTGQPVRSQDLRT
jgi:hypothetical protein